MELECSDGDTSDSMEYPTDDETSVYERRALKMKRRRDRAFLAQFKPGELAKASQLLPKKDESDEFRPVAETPRKKRTYKRRSMPAVVLQPRKSLRLDGKPVKYAGLDGDFKEPPTYRRRQSLGGKPGRPTFPRIAMAREVDFNPDSLSGEICYNAQKTYSQNGTTCHQCRQKTIDLKSRCYSPYCRGVRGQFCGYCLRQRYGEDVAVVLRDPKWKCPPCRNICNCSICRRRYGKQPTGQLFQYVSCQGYANVKDYLAEKNDLILIEDGDEDDEQLEGKDEDGEDSVKIKQERVTPEPEEQTANSQADEDTNEGKQQKTKPKPKKRGRNSTQENHEEASDAAFHDEQSKTTPKSKTPPKKKLKRDEASPKPVNEEQTKATPKRRRKTRNNEKENLVPDIQIKEEPIDLDLDPSLYPDIDLKPTVVLVKLDPDEVENGCPSTG